MVSKVSKVTLTPGEGIKGTVQQELFFHTHPPSEAWQVQHEFLLTHAYHEVPTFSPPLTIGPAECAKRFR